MNVDGSIRFWVVIGISTFRRMICWLVSTERGKSYNKIGILDFIDGQEKIENGRC